MANHAIAKGETPPAVAGDRHQAGSGQKRPLRCPPGGALPACDEWLDWSCQMISGTLHGELHIVNRTATEFDPPRLWNGAEDAASEPLLALTPLVSRVAETARRLVLSAGASEVNGLPGDVVACPVFLDDKITAVVALVLKPRNELQLRAVAQLLGWGVTWLEKLLSGNGSNESAARTEGPEPGDAVRLLLEARSLQDGATALCNHLAETLSLDRVSLGIREGLRITLVGVSGHAVAVGRSGLSQAIEAAMTEAADQAFCKPYPGEGDPALAHLGLLRQHGMRAVITLPLRGDAGLKGALTIESANGAVIAPDSIRAIEAMTPSLAPAVALLAGRESSIDFRVRAWFPEKARSRAIVAAVAALVSIICLLPSPFRIGGDAAIEGVGQRAISAAIDGIVATAPARAGDELREGDVLATMEAQEMEIQRARWTSERDRYAREYGDALVNGERAAAGIARARMQQAEAELGLVSTQIERATLRAPFSGIVVSGDFSQRLGAPVQRGEIMFEMAPTSDYRVSVDVSERDIGLVTDHARGVLRLAGLPDEPMQIEVTRISPVASAEAGSNTFRVEARLLESPPSVRPGMQGIARFEAGTRPLIWTWIHDLAAGVRIWFWRWGL